MPRADAETFGPYVALRSLGRGGMGVVYEARHRSSGRRVALKTVREASASLVAGIRREIRTLLRLSHPDLVTIVDEGVEAGVPWYAMELIEGRTLREEMHLRAEGSGSIDGPASEVPTVAVPRRRGGEPWWTTALGTLPETAPAPPPEARPFELAGAAAMVARICEPLSYLHGEGIVHRDLKPENVVIRSDGRPAILDLGTIGNFSARGGRESLERAGDVAGTALYMAPEQAAGELVDARTDIYALGCILYELLTGQPPFSGTLREILALHRVATPPPPSRRVPALPAVVDALVARMLAKSPRDRPGHALAVAHELRGLHDAQETGAAAQLRRSVYLFRPQLRGREATTAALERHLDAAAAGSGRLVVLAGAPGAGKTTAAMAIAQGAFRRGMEVQTCECRRQGVGAGSLLPQLLEPVVDACREGGLATTRHLLGEQGPVVATVVPEAGGLPGASVAPRQVPPDAARLNDAVRTVWRAFGAGTRRLWILDDVHLADAPSLELLLHLVRSEALVDLPVLVLATCRPPRDAPLLARLLARATEALELPSMLEEDLTAAAGDMLGLPGPSALPRAFAARASGNPSLLAEHVRLAVDEGHLRQRADGSWVASEEGAWDAALPSSIAALVLRRVRRLRGNARAVAEASAVVGGDIEAGAVAAVGGLDLEDVLDGLEELRREGVVEVVGQVHRFLLDGTAAAVAEAMDPERSRELHRAAAARIEAGSSSDRDVAELARHYLGTGDLARAREALDEAARCALARHATAAGEALLRAYLAIVPPGSVDEARGRLCLGDQLLADRSPEEALLELERARMILASGDDRLLEARATHAKGVVLEGLARFHEARAVMEPAIPLARAAGDPLLLASLLARVGTIKAIEEGADASRPLHDEALAILERAGNPAADAWRIYTSIAAGFFTIGDMGVARHAQQRARRPGRQRRRPRPGHRHGQPRRHPDERRTRRGRASHARGRARASRVGRVRRRGARRDHEPREPLRGARPPRGSAPPLRRCRPHRPPHRSARASGDGALQPRKRPGGLRRG